MKAARYLNWRINRLVNLEDKELIERVQAGMASSSYHGRPAGRGRGVPAQLRPSHARAVPGGTRGHGAAEGLEHQPQGAAAAVSSAVRKPRYERQVASDRREALVDAAIESLKRWGHEGLSVRRIAAEAGVSIGLINHHFPHKDSLVAESYRAFSRRLSSSFEAAVAAAGNDPRTRLRAYFNAFFSNPNLDPQVLTAWVVYWSLVQVSPEMRAVRDEEGRGYSAVLGRLVSDLAQARGGAARGPRARRDRPHGACSMASGSQLCLDPTSIRPKDAAALCDDWVDRVIGPALAPSASRPATRL